MPSESTTQHRAEADSLGPIRVAIVTISDSRTLETDTSGKLMEDLLLEGGHVVHSRVVLRDEPDQIRAHVVALADGGEVHAVLTNGGTGIAPRDGTFEAVSSLLDRELPGFGELFRMLSWHEVGAAAMLSRAMAGLRGRTLIFSTPGSRNAVEVAMTRLILPELRHLVYEMNGIREKR